MQPAMRREGKIKHSTTHVIETKGRPVRARARRLTPEKIKIVKKWFEEALRNGDIRPSKSPWASPLHVTPKKGPEKWRICGDYRGLNAQTKPDRYPVPNLQDFNLELDGATIFSMIDIKRAYHQIPVAEEDFEKMAIITPFGLFESVTMPFGLRNAAQTFQRFLDSLFRDLPHVYVYIDDILVTSCDETTHKKLMRTVLKRLHDAGIVINIAKCQYMKEKVVFLGHEVTKDGIKPDQSRVSAICEYPLPMVVRDLRRFTGVVNFYRRTIPHAAEIQRKLHTIIKTNKKNDQTQLEWTEEAKGAFIEFKTALANATLLAHPKENAELILSTDASDSAIGGALQQKVGKELQPLAFFSRKLSKAEKRYSTYDREFLAIFASIKYFYNQLEGRQFVVYTDHKPLQYAFVSQSEKASPRVIRQLDFIAQFTTDIRYLPGPENVPADALSRIAALQQVPELDYRALQRHRKKTQS